MKTNVVHFREYLTCCSETGKPAVVFMTKAEREQMGPEAPYALIHNGGYTEAYATDDNGDTVAQAIARCSRDDTFNRRLGRTIAMNRLNLKLGTKKAKAKEPQQDYESAGTERLLKALFGTGGKLVA